MTIGITMAFSRLERAPSALVVAALLTLLASGEVACGGGGNDTSTSTTGATSSSTGTGGQGGSGTSTVSSSSGFDTSSSSSTGTGTGGAPATAGTPGQETVSAGQVCSSPSYKMVMTLGQPTQNQGTTTSPGYKLRGGLVGATQK